MRINVYSQELTAEVQLVSKEANTGIVYQAAMLMLHSSERLHHPPQDDDRSAVVFWFPKSSARREEMAKAFEYMASLFRNTALEDQRLEAASSKEASRVVAEIPVQSSDHPTPSAEAQRLADWIQTAIEDADTEDESNSVIITVAVAKAIEAALRKGGA